MNIANVPVWWVILRTSIQERLVYRGDFALSTFMRFLPIVTQIFLWAAVFSGASGDDFQGYGYNDFIAYYLLIMISRSFSSMPGLASGITTQIRDGEIKKFLIQPIDMVGYLFMARIAHKLVYYAISIIPFAVVFYLCRGYFPGWPDAATMGVFVASLLLSFMLGFFLEAAIGFVGFWFLEVSALLFIYMMMTYFLSGHMFPVRILPEPLADAVTLLPPYYLAGFPADVFLGKLSHDEMMRGLTVLLGWVGLFMVCCRVAWWRGVKRYSGFGG